MDAAEISQIVKAEFYTEYTTAFLIPRLPLRTATCTEKARPSCYAEKQAFVSLKIT